MTEQVLTTDEGNYIIVTVYEIVERLRAERDEYHETNKRLRAQRDRLLAALKVYRDDGHCPTCTADGGCFSNHRPGCAFLAARAAIAAVEKEP